MTREALEARRADLQSGIVLLRTQIADAENALEKLKANLTATMGALAECQHWIDKTPPAGG